MRRSVFISSLLLVFAEPAQALFTGNEQYNREELNTEIELDPEYLLDLQAYAPFWEPPPAAIEPLAFIRNTEGSLDSNQFYVRREARIRGMYAGTGYWGYHLRQEEDLEQDFFYQRFEAQSPAWGPFAFRIFGQPTHEKQDSDLGAGAMLRLRDETFLTVDATMVDFLFNSKNLHDERDRKKHYNLATKLESHWGSGNSAELAWEWDTPLSREFDDDDQVFENRGDHLRLRAQTLRHRADIFFHDEHRKTSSLSTSAPQQDFEKEIFGTDLARWFEVRQTSATLGVLIVRRHGAFTNYSDPTQTITLQRWVANPYIGIPQKLTKHLAMDWAVYLGMRWEKRDFPGTYVEHDSSFQAKLKTALRIDFTENVGLLLNPTWDLDEVGGGRTFDGGNVQFRAQLP